MRITFLGTGTSQGVPVIACGCNTCSSTDKKDKRLRSSLLIEAGATNIVIDAGPDFRQQMLRESVRQLDAILLTHEHKDHIGGMDDVRAYNYKSRKAIDVYGDERVHRAVRREYPYVFAEHKYPGIPMMNLKIVDDSPFYIGGVEIVPIKVYHFRLPIYGFRIGDLAYITDANYIPEKSKSLLNGVKYFIINALRKEKHLSHFCLSEAINIIGEISPLRAFITHIGHEMGLHSEVMKEMPDNIELGYDGLEFEF
ncbi:MAG: MBL fold metallo-hydrolase [Bacteroidales bacterium]|nr:MBL fold metallo-hydrolase [Bacteroidales bacterium]